jgi:hypothetical protein
MSFIETIKAAGTVVVELVKANPVVAGCAIVGTAAVGYGTHRVVKAYRNPKPTTIPPAVLAEVQAAGLAPAAPDDSAAQATAALLSMSRDQAEEAGLLNEWNTALKIKLYAAQKK